MANIYVIMGPAGSGKSSTASRLAELTGWMMIEADEFHPKKNVEKQRNGLPLTDEDRIEWLDRLVIHINAQTAETLIFACSALTPFVQARLIKDLNRSCVWVLLDVPEHVLEQRLKARTDHFMPASLLSSQIRALSPPEGVIRIDANRPLAQVCDAILEQATDWRRDPDTRSRALSS